MPGFVEQEATAHLPGEVTLDRSLTYMWQLRAGSALLISFYYPAKMRCHFYEGLSSARCERFRVSPALLRAFFFYFPNARGRASSFFA